MMSQGLQVHDELVGFTKRRTCVDQYKFFIMFLPKSFKNNNLCHV